MRLFRLTLTTVEVVTIEAETMREAKQRAEHLRDEANAHSHHGEKTTLHVAEIKKQHKAGERAKRLWERYSGAMSRRKDRKCEHWPGIMHITKEIQLAEAAAFDRGWRTGQKKRSKGRK